MRDPRPSVGACASVHASVAERWCLLLITGLLSQGPNMAQLNLVTERRAMIHGDVRGVMHRLEVGIDQLPPDAPPLQRVRMLELLGEQYHRLSDIGHAKTYWDEGLRLRQVAFGDSSAEAAVGYAYRARYHNYMAASQLDHQRSAFQVASRAKHLLNARADRIDPGERTLILREYAYAHKVVDLYERTEHHAHLVRTRTFFRQALHAAATAQDTIWMAQVLHDIGNTFTDEAGDVDLPVPKRTIVDSAQACYQRSIALMTTAGFGNSDAVMMDHYTTALLYRYAYGPDSVALAVEAFDRALRTMLQQVGQPPDADPLQYAPRIANPAQMVELLYQRADLLQKWIDPRTELQQVNDAIRTIEAAVPYWEQMLRESKSHELQKVTGSYSHFPFRLGSLLYLHRHRLTGDRDDLLASLRWCERNRNALDQRKRMNLGLDPSSTNGPELHRTDPIAPSGTVVIVFNHPGSGLVYVIDETGLSVTEIPEFPADPDHSTGSFKAFPVADPKWTPATYAREGHRWYDLLLAPVLEHHDARNIIIVPYGSLALVPFEALCTSPTATAWANVAFVGRTHTVRYARSVSDALAPTSTCPRTNAMFATTVADGLSALPFAQALAARLHASFAESDLDPALDRRALLGSLNDPGLLHIASHGANPGVPDSDPQLHLADGTWPATSILNERTRRTLVVLSTCSSGSGRNFQGEGVMSIAHAFLGAGAKAVVHTLWPVDDRATSEIIEGFYAALDAGLPASEALHQAKLEFIAHHADDGLAHPFYWSGVVLSGAEIDLEPTSNHTTWYAVVVGLLLLAGAYWFNRSRSACDRAAN